MARVSTYLNFNRQTEAAFEFYRRVFGTEYAGAGILRHGDIPAEACGGNTVAEADRKLVMHVELPILGGHVLMGTDCSESMGMTVRFGNNVFINLEPDTRADADRLFAALVEGGKVDMPMQDMFWGGYFGSLTDRFGVQWMINHQPMPAPGAAA